ncbi:molecular chaperone HtpG [Pseudomarimonas arenosa]|uniref:Chaperone protein HtpG n=1 Tax=Pseudomarimonas arenosa TaxID=2774145 RepID=A0AAW3ZPH4_9GAMM|nr:molecular chaperone HtpG [Pseudomarimonas arenosa]MBD8526191.1 molecular chaperone HtpG [Pseudomarimonas arenosa]
MTTAVESFKFEAEVQQVLHLVIHSLYSNRDIFLRELISNASDACDKLRFEALSDATLYGEQGELKIRISADSENKTLTVSDTGIGMSREELIENLGTIARSGTRKFIEQLSATQKADANLIGQFGVGFYSAFIVADKVTVETRRAGSDQGWRWVSDGAGEFTLEPAAGLSRGTCITLHLKSDAEDYLQPWKLRGLINTWSDHIAFPIELPVLKEGKPTDEFEVANQAAALWTRPKAEISDEEYQAFYKHVGHDFNDALAWTHNRVEGNQNFTSLLFLPSKAPFDFTYNRDERKGLKLYVKRVFIMDAAEQMLPNYLRFVRGVVDSDDLPLNVSRELLQNNRQLDKLKSALTRRVLDLLDKVANDDAAKYAEFWAQFGALLKEGVTEDHGNRERIAKLLRFASTKSEKPDQLTSLDEYIGRMPASQEEIFYLTADSWNAARHSPQLEGLKARSVEVLLLHERIDEWMIGYLHEYAGKSLKNIAKGELDLDKLGEPKDKEQREKLKQEAADTVKRFKDLLGDKVKEVRVSDRLTESAACLVLEDQDMALHMQRLLKAAGHEAPSAQPSLEINPGHGLIKRFEAESDDERATDLALLVFEQAQLAEGAALDDPASFVARMNRAILG